MGIIVIAVALLLLALQSLLSSLSVISDPQLRVLEAGFERLKFNDFISSSFFIIAVLFVLFDLELVLLLPGVLFLLRRSLSKFWFFSLLFFVIGSLGVEWKISGLKWSS